jgi:hypothetical protein
VIGAVVDRVFLWIRGFVPPSSFAPPCAAPNDPSAENSQLGYKKLIVILLNVIERFYRHISLDISAFLIVY